MGGAMVIALAAGMAAVGLPPSLRLLVFVLGLFGVIVPLSNVVFRALMRLLGGLLSGKKQSPIN